jgi:hypothetical protein
LASLLYCIVCNLPLLPCHIVFFTSPPRPSPWSCPVFALFPRSFSLNTLHSLLFSPLFSPFPIRPLKRILPPLFSLIYTVERSHPHPMALPHPPPPQLPVSVYIPLLLCPPASHFILIASHYCHSLQLFGYRFLPVVGL